jgi:hypothetical protein
MVVGLMISTSGCAPTGRELYERAREVSVTMRQEVAALQLHVFDGEWDSQPYGDIPDACGANGFRFYAYRAVPLDAEWRMPQAKTEDKIRAVADWLVEHGWSDVIVRTYAGGVSSQSIEASKPSAYVDSLLVMISTGARNDLMSLRMTSTCEAGSSWDLDDLIAPDSGPEYEAPLLEHPAAEPRFGTLPMPTPSPSPES